MRLINIDKLDEFEATLNTIDNLNEYNFVSYSKGEFGYVVVNILFLMYNFIKNSIENNKKIICFCIEGQEIFYQNMGVSILFIFKINKLNAEKGLKESINDYQIVKTSYGETKFDSQKKVMEYLYAFHKELQQQDFENTIRKYNFNDIFLTISDYANKKSKYGLYSRLTTDMKLSENNFCFSTDYPILHKFYINNTFLLQNLYIPSQKFIEEKHISIILRNSYKWKQRDSDMDKVQNIINKYLAMDYKIIIIEDIIKSNLPETSKIIHINMPFLHFTTLFNIIGHSEIIFGTYSGVFEACLYKLNNNLGMTIKEEFINSKQGDKFMKDVLPNYKKFQLQKNKTLIFE